MLFYITGGVGAVLCVLAIVLVIVFHIKIKSKILPIILFVLGFLLFMGSGYLFSTGGELPFGGGEPPELTGEWKQVNSSSEDSYQGIYISNDTIEVYWISDNGNTAALYWAGSFVPPEDGGKEYTWESENDTGRTDGALLASADPIKEFTYKNGKLTYSADALGVTVTIEAEKQEWGYAPGIGAPAE